MQHIGSFVTSRRNAFGNDQFTRGEGQLLGLRYADGRLIRPMPLPEVMSEPCPRWANKPTLAEALQQTSLDHIDYLWLIDTPPQQLPRDPRLRAISRTARSVLFAVGS
jgi:hypothetical protein